MIPMAASSSFHVELESSDDFALWRDKARSLLRARIAPVDITWSVPGARTGNLFVSNTETVPEPLSPPANLRVSRQFLETAKSACLHSDPLRFDLLYRLLWQLQSRPRMMDDAVHPDVRRLNELARVVRHDIHKMRAFVRFRSIVDPVGRERFVAWFEPAHHILRANAQFFVSRFTNLDWSILTPRGSLHWEGGQLLEGPPASRSDAPAGDPMEDLWRRYYSSTFNPARLKVGTMLKEMPRRYWRNMPEASLIPNLIAGAQAREAKMVANGKPLFDAAESGSLDAISKSLGSCRRCPIGCNGTRAVAGEGVTAPALMIVGEQPGDTEERQGRPFVGPAGQLLDRHLERAGIDRNAVYVTNAVKHFKFKAGAKRRIHDTPSAREIDICRWWLDAERKLIRPRHILALGASASRGILGRTASIGRERGEPIVNGEELVWVTVHPSFLLRAADRREREEEKFQADLQQVAAAMKMH